LMELTKNSSPGGANSAEGLLRNGKRHGKWKYYYRNGRLKAVGSM
jgi:antitoxin component YwqK of YwqJK toxin-antitoxin module